MKRAPIEFTNTATPIAFERVGNGPCVVFLHGIGGNRKNWAAQLPFFGKQYCAIAWDARGYGDSGEIEGSLDFGDFSDDLQGLLDHVGAKKSHIVGLSMGGMIAQDFYQKHPNRVASLTLVATSDGFCSVTEEERAEFLRLRLEPLENGKTIEDIAPPLVQVLCGPDAKPEHRKQVLKSLLALRPKSYKKVLHAIVTTNFRSVLPGISVPTLVINGGEDKVTPLRESETLRTLIPNAKTKVVEGAGHLINIEETDEFNDLLIGFLSCCKDEASII